MEKVMTSMQGTLLLQQRMSVKMTSVAPLSTSRSQHSGDSLVAASAHDNAHRQATCFSFSELFTHKSCDLRHKDGNMCSKY